MSIDELAGFAFARECEREDDPKGRQEGTCAWAAIKSFQIYAPVTLPLKKPYPSY